MQRGRIFRIVVLSGILVAGCSKLPGLRVLTGQDAQNANSSGQTVQALNLVMADKTGGADSTLTAAADRIEAADNMIDIIEIRKDSDNRVFTVNMLFNPPNVDLTTQDGQIQQSDAIRRAFEVTWQGVMPVSDGTDKLDIRLLAAATVTTLDHGRSFLGAVVVEGTIDRTAAAKYLNGTRSLSTFVDLIINGNLNYQTPNQFVPYSGTPNHPMFMLPTQSASGQ